MFDVLVCDDEIADVRQVCALLREFSDRSGIDLSVTSETSAQSVCAQDRAFDIAILDIEMPDTDGLRLSEYLMQKNANVTIIILTAHMKYLDNAMRINVFRYFSKPLDPERFFRGMTEAVEKCRLAGKTILVEADKRVLRLRTSEILYIETQKNGSMIVTRAARYNTKKKTQEWEQEIALPNVFVYSHRSFLVNLQNVISLGKDSITFQTDNGEQSFPVVSQRYYQRFRKAFFAFVEAEL